MPDDTQRRQRRRLGGRAVSALEGLTLDEKPQVRLNTVVPDTPHCAWPGCEVRMWKGPNDSNRYGVLCETHAVDVAIAVTQHQRDLNRMQEFFDHQSTEQAIRFARWRAEDERYEAEKAALRKDRDGFVYYLRVGERLKIGYSVDVKRRMRAYPPGSRLLAVEPGDRELETRRHQQFAGSLADGREWFRPTPDIMELVQELVDVYGEPKRFAHHYRRKEEPVRISRTA